MVAKTRWSDSDERIAKAYHSMDVEERCAKDPGLLAMKLMKRAGVPDGEYTNMTTKIEQWQKTDRIMLKKRA